MEFGSIAELGSACVALAALGAVAYEYRHTRRQKQLELAQELSYQLELNDLLRFATTSLDWAAGLIPVPEEWRDVIGKPAIEPDPRAMQVALLPKLSEALQNDTIGLLYRHAFVALFNHFERVKELKERRAVLIEDLGAFGWIAAELINWTYAPPERAELFFTPAIRRWYGHKGLEQFVRELAARFPKNETR